MSFNSFDFLIFFPIVVLIYFLLPRKLKQVWLLCSSYYFYMSWNAVYAVLILASTGITYAAGILLEKAKGMNMPADAVQRRKKWIVALSFCSNLGILFFFKYMGFATRMINAAANLIHIQLSVPAFDILLPVGISFYTFQALGYTVDVYRDDIRAEKNFIQYALFVSFFPQLVAGPIERSGNLIRQLAEPKKFSFDRFREGFLQMLWGFFLKIVVADRIAVFVDTVYGDYANYGGYYLIVATVLFAVQIYCDFWGYSTIASGAARILGISLMDNFDAPYLSTSVAAFWRRWHISLTTWFRDYLYIPLGGNRKGKIRKYVNKMIVFLVSGLWHGAGFTFILWGGLNGLYQVIGEITLPARKKVTDLFRLHRDSLGHRLFQGLVTFILVDFSWIFFRAGELRDAIDIIKSIFRADNLWILTDGSLYSCGLDLSNFFLMLAGIGIIVFADCCRRKHIVIREVILRQDGWFRWLFIALAVTAIITFGIWGPGYISMNFIYFRF